MAKPISEAADLLETNWCIGDLHEEFDDKGNRVDRFCALGALAQTTNTVVLTEGGQHWDDTATYMAMQELPETREIALGIMTTKWFNKLPKATKKHYIETFDCGDYNAIVYEFNDTQENNKKVVKLFRQISKEVEDI